VDLPVIQLHLTNVFGNPGGVTNRSEERIGIVKLAFGASSIGKCLLRAQGPLTRDTTLYGQRIALATTACTAATELIAIAGMSEP
jgi:hypothetical protein